MKVRKKKYAPQAQVKGRRRAQAIDYAFMAVGTISAGEGSIGGIYY